MRRAAKVDANHKQIVTALRRCGCSVQDLSAVGEGCPDLLVGVGGKNLLLEVKDGEKRASERKLTPHQVEWHGRWKGQKCVVTSVDEALAVVGLITGKEA